MKGLLFKIVAAAAVLAAVAVPAAAAKSHTVKLSLLPLPKSALGASAGSLALAQDSGVVTNVLAAYHTATASAGQIVKLGRVSGYALDYGDAYGSGSGLAGVQTEVDRYKTAAYAKKSLGFWKKDDAEHAALYALGGLQAKASPFKAPALGAARFGVLSTIGVSGLAPLATADLEAADGKYVLVVKVSSTSASSAKSVAAKLAKALDARLKHALAGKLKAKPVKLPARLPAGPPAGGPDLSMVALQTTDFTGSATPAASSYDALNPQALSEYGASFQPAGPFDDVEQIIDWYPTAGDATFLTNVEKAIVTVVLGGSGQVTPVDVSSVGDGASASLLTASSNGTTAYAAVVTLSRGQAADLAIAGSTSAIQTSDVQRLAQAMASHLDAVVTG